MAYNAAGNYMNVDDNTLIGGDVRISSGRGTATSDEDAYGNRSIVDGNTQIDGNVIITQGRGECGRDGGRLRELVAIRQQRRYRW